LPVPVEISDGNEVARALRQVQGGGRAERAIAVAEQDVYASALVAALSAALRPPAHEQVELAVAVDVARGDGSSGAGRDVGDRRGGHERPRRGRAAEQERRTGRGSASIAIAGRDNQVRMSVAIEVARGEAAELGGLGREEQAVLEHFVDHGGTCSVERIAARDVG